MLLYAGIFSVFALPQDGQYRCATLEVLRQAPPPLLTVPSVPNKNGKQERDAICNCPNQKFSTNFVVKWGSGVSESKAQEVLDLFEYAWSLEHEQLGYEAPIGTNDHYFNVYIGDSGGGTPGSSGAAGYFTVDQEGYPYIVIASGTLAEEEYLRTTIAHEFFHALQGATFRYDYDEMGSGAWYWEATANWVESVAYPNDLTVAAFLIGYAFLPHYPVNYFNYPDTGTLDEYHQYGAFLFPLHLTEIEADNDVIRSSWQDTTSESDPMKVLDGYLSDFGISIEDAWLNHTAHMAVMDYAQGEGYELWLEYYESWYSEGENRIAERITGVGTDGWRNGPASLEPMRFGHNTILAKDLSAEVVTFTVRGDQIGSRGSEAEWGGRVVQVRDGQYSYYQLAGDGDDISVVVQDILPSDEFYMTVGVWTERWQPNRVYDETFSYSFSIGTSGEAIEEEEEEEEPELDTPSDGLGTLSPGGKDCQGCASASLDEHWLFSLLLLGVICRRQG